MGVRSESIHRVFVTAYNAFVWLIGVFSTDSKILFATDNTSRKVVKSQGANSDFHNTIPPNIAVICSAYSFFIILSP